MSLLVWAAVAAGAFVIGAVVVVAVLLFLPRGGRREPDQPARPMFSLTPETAVQPLRMRSQFDVETDEDLTVIEDAYRDQRRAERVDQAIERLMRLKPAAKK